MKKLLLFVFLLVAGKSICFAQDYLVYTVKGNITVNNDDKQVTVVPGMVLKSNSLITIPAESRLVVLYETNKELYTIKNPTTDTLGNLLTSDEYTTQRLTESYLAFIKKKITESGKPKDRNYRQTTGSSYRDADTLLINALVPTEQPADTLKKNKENHCDVPIELF